MMRYWMWHGKWWKVELVLDKWLSFGIHLDFGTRKTGIRYAPYIDVYLGVLILSLGLRPHLSGEYDLLCGHARGGEDSRRV
jgi:hypothetical protein